MRRAATRGEARRPMASLLNPLAEEAWPMWFLVRRVAMAMVTSWLLGAAIRRWPSLRFLRHVQRVRRY